MKLKIDIENDIRNILLNHECNNSTNNDLLVKSFKDLFDSHLDRVVTELLNESSFGTIHIHTGKPNNFH